MAQFRTFTDNEKSTYPITILAPKLQADLMMKEYLDPSNLDPEDVIAYELFTSGKKTKVADQKEFLDDMMPLLDEIGTKYVLVTDPNYFKTLTGVAKTDAYLGYVLPNVYPMDMAGEFNVVFLPNYRQVFYNPAPTRARIAMALEAIWSHTAGTYNDPGHDLLHFAEYPTQVADIAAWLQKLIEMRCPLACDIEGFSLKHYSAGIGTIAFAWNKHEGIAFPVDLGPAGAAVRKMLKQFFVEIKERILWHNISYDACVLIYQLFMGELIDQTGLLTGLDVMLRNWDDTKLIAYLATNSCAGNKLSLKDQAQEFAGNYAVEDIKDITLIPLDELLEYNLVDACSTWYVYEKHWQTMVDDQQLDIYIDLFKPAIVDIIQMQLTGMPLNMNQVKQAKVLLEVDRDSALSRMHSHKIARNFVSALNEEWVVWKNSTLKKKRVTIDDAKEEFNPNSAPQLQRLLYEDLALPIIERTKSKAPATKAEVLEKLKAYTEDPDVIAFINALLDFKAVDKIYGTFIPAMESAVQGSDGCHYLFGNFNLGGTVSCRLSSSGPNLQTIPATGSKYAKLIKSCFMAPEGHLMIGLDFNSLEDMISALTTKDPNKLKVYTDGFDGHCLRAYSYFPEQMQDIDPTSVESINSIAKKYKHLRQDSKMPTFALTYQGTYITLMAKGGFSKIVAQQIEARYHNLYKHSDEWVATRLDEASRVGYVTAAFGLRVRTPLLHQVIRGNSATPFEAEAEGRTAGNALGQSWCLLNSRASSEFMAFVRKGKYRNVIRPIAHIHDAQYYIIPDDIDVLMYVNEHLVKAVKWQEHPDIQHPEVKLGGNLSIFYPSWAEEIELPNQASEETIRALTQEAA